MYLSTLKKMSTCTWYIFGVLGDLSTWSTVLDPNPGIHVRSGLKPTKKAIFFLTLETGIMIFFYREYSGSVRLLS